MIVVEREWNESREIQAEARLHRNGQKNAVQVHYIIGANTIDIDIDELISHKHDIFDEVIGSDTIETKLIERIMRYRLEE